MKTEMKIRKKNYKNKIDITSQHGINFSKRLFRVGSCILLINILLLTLGTSIFSANAFVTAYNSDSYLRVNEQIHDEAYVDYGGAYLSRGFFTKGSTIHINYTVLPQSNGSVEFTFHYTNLDYATWLPVPPNFTLAIGESYAGNFTLNRTINQATLPFAYDACTTIIGEDATVHWWYEILVTGKTPAAGFLIVSTTLFVITVISAFHSKRKAVKK